MTGPLDRIRKICLALPEAHEVEAWCEPTFRVRNRLFAMYAASGNHHGGCRTAVGIESTHVTQGLLVQSDAERFFAPPHVDASGWIGVHQEHAADWRTIGEILRDGYLLTARKPVAALLQAAAPSAARPRRK